MSEEFLKIDYNSNTKTWKSINYPFRDITNRSVGEAFLQSMRSTELTRVLEYHYDVSREKQARDIYEEAIKVAVNLQRLGIEKGDVIILFSGYNYMTSVLTFGALLIGAIVNFFEVEFENENIDRIFEILKPGMILYEENFEKNLMQSLKRQKPKTLKYIYCIDSPVTPNVLNELLESPGYIDYDKFEPIAIDNPQLEVAFLVLTSGSTGLPKVAQLTHSLVLNSVYIWWDNSWNYEPLTKDSILISLSPLRWISQYVLLLQSAILGVKRICCNRAATGSYGLQILRETNPSHFFAVPSFFYNVLIQLEEDDFESLKSLKHIQLGGEPPSLLITNLTRKYAINSKLFYTYGMSEVSCVITSDEKMSGGQLIRGFEMQILDDNLKPLGPNQKGQIALKTPYPFIGYKGLDNSKYILQNDFFLNGDYGYFDKHNILYLLARCKDLIKYQSITLVPSLVESLTLRVPEVYTTRLVGYHRYPEETNEIAALFVALKSGVTLSQNEVSRRIRDILKAELSDDELLLIHHIYIMNDLPLTTCGKIDRCALQQQALLKAQLS